MESSRRQVGVSLGWRRIIDVRLGVARGARQQRRETKANLSLAQLR